MFEKEIESLENNSLIRKIVERSSPQGRLVRVGDRELINFASNDYLGLANDPRLREASSRAINTWGSGAGASRLLGGGTDLHEKLEGIIAKFKNTPAALLFNSGYAANTGAIPALATEGDAIFSDALNHASIIDGCRLSSAKLHIYRHRDMGHLEELLNKNSSLNRKLIITDTVFSMEGDLAPLKELAALALKHKTLLYTDDAHGTGVLGKGRGALAEAGLGHAPHIIQMGTLSKAAGSVGGFIAADGNMISWLINKARPFIFSTALPPASVAASIKALELIGTEPALVSGLWENRSYLIKKLEAAGIDTGCSASAIIPVYCASPKEALKLAGALQEKGFYAPAIRPPTVPESMIRITVTKAHVRTDLEALAEALKELLRKI
jgi:8-amino-7-oxononanoate synthase